jgi:hypothetical protein
VNHREYVIDVKNSFHVTWLAETLGVTEDALLDATHRVGNNVHAVEGYFGTRVVVPRVYIKTVKRVGPAR